MPIPNVTDLDQTVSTFIYARARNKEDRKAGRICSCCSMWAPGHMIVYMDGQAYIREHAPGVSAKTQAKRAADFKASLQSPV